MISKSQYSALMVDCLAVPWWMKQLFLEEYAHPFCVPCTWFVRCKMALLHSSYTTITLCFSFCPQSCWVTNPSLIFTIYLHTKRLCRLCKPDLEHETGLTDLFQYWSKITIFPELLTKSFELPKNNPKNVNHASAARTGSCRVKSKMFCREDGF